VGARRKRSVYFIGNGDNEPREPSGGCKTIRKLALTGESYPGGTYALNQIIDLKKPHPACFTLAAHTQNSGSFGLAQREREPFRADQQRPADGSTTLYWIHGSDG